MAFRMIFFIFRFIKNLWQGSNCWKHVSRKHQKREVQRLLAKLIHNNVYRFFHNNISAGHTSLLQVYRSVNLKKAGMASRNIVIKKTIHAKKLRFSFHMGALLHLWFICITLENFYIWVNYHISGFNGLTIRFTAAFRAGRYNSFRRHHPIQTTFAAFGWCYFCNRASVEVYCPVSSSL